MEVLLIASLVLLGKELSKAPTQCDRRTPKVVLERNNKYPIDNTKVVEPQIPQLPSQTPFFTSAKSQNTNDSVKNQYLETFTGNDKLMFQHKREVENDCIEKNIEYGQVYGTQNLSSAQYSDEVNRYKASMDGVNWMNNTLPFEQQRIGPGLNAGTDVSAKGGFHDTYRILPDNVNSYKKHTHTGRVLSGKGETTKRQLENQVDSHRPERFYCADKRPYMPTKSNFNAQQANTNYNNISDTNRGTCNDFLVGPASGNGNVTQVNSTRGYDSSLCGPNPGQAYVPLGSYNEPTYLVHNSDREQCTKGGNVFSNNGHQMQISDSANVTQRGTYNEHGGFVNNSGFGKTATDKYTAPMTQREDTFAYSGNPGYATTSTVRNHELNVTQRGDASSYMSGVKGAQSMTNYTAALNSDPYLSKESVLHARASGPQNVNILDDPENIVRNTCNKIDENCNRVNGHAMMPGTYGEMGEMESRGVTINNRRIELDVSNQLSQNEFAIQPLHR